MHQYLEASKVFTGRTATRFEKTANDRIEIALDDGKGYLFHHSQDCCESVSIHDIQGELAHLVGSPFIEARHDLLSEWPADVKKSEYCESFTWSVLTFATEKGRVVIRWLGESNGYYGEGVDLDEHIIAARSSQQKGAGT